MRLIYAYFLKKFVTFHVMFLLLVFAGILSAFSLVEISSLIIRKEGTHPISSIFNIISSSASGMAFGSQFSASIATFMYRSNLAAVNEYIAGVGVGIKEKYMFAIEVISSILIFVFLMALSRNLEFFAFKKRVMGDKNISTKVLIRDYNSNNKFAAILKIDHDHFCSKDVKYEDIDVLFYNERSIVYAKSGNLEKGHMVLNEALKIDTASYENRPFAQEEDKTNTAKQQAEKGNTKTENIEDYIGNMNDSLADYDTNKRQNVFVEDELKIQTTLSSASFCNASVLYIIRNYLPNTTHFSISSIKSVFTGLVIDSRYTKYEIMSMCILIRQALNFLCSYIFASIIVSKKRETLSVNVSIVFCLLSCIFVSFFSGIFDSWFFNSKLSVFHVFGPFMPSLIMFSALIFWYKNENF